MTSPVRYHFISGLPRSGSTLLSALLRQNPRFHASMSSPVAGLVTALLNEMSEKNEFSVFLDDTKRQRLIRGLVTGYYADTPAEVAFDTNRAWCTRLSLLSTLFPESRVIACVRSLPAIFESIERLVQENAFQPSSIFGYQSGGTVYTRVNALAGPEGMVGYAYDALKQACYGPAAEHLLLVRYESLVESPERVLKELYAFLGEPEFPHDLQRVRLDVTAFDEKAGTPGLHQVRPVVSAEPYPQRLPPDLRARFVHDAFWEDPQRIPPQVRVL